MEREDIRSPLIWGYTLPQLYVIYDEIVDALEGPHLAADPMERCRLLVDRELVGGCIDRRLELIQNGLKYRQESREDL